MRCVFHHTSIPGHRGGRGWSVHIRPGCRGRVGSRSSISGSIRAGRDRPDRLRTRAAVGRTARSGTPGAVDGAGEPAVGRLAGWCGIVARTGRASPWLRLWTRISTRQGTRVCKAGALGFISSVVIGVASTAPGYSLAASLGLVAVVVGLQAPAIMLLAFVPMLFIASAYYYLNRADPDCGTTFAWVTRAMGPHIGLDGRLGDHRRRRDRDGQPGPDRGPVHVLPLSAPTAWRTASGGRWPSACSGSS